MSHSSLPVVEGQTSDRPIEKQNLSVTDGLKVVRLRVRAGATVPDHHSNVDVVVTCVRGEGLFKVAGQQQAISAGSVIVMKPGERHAIDAESDLELVVVHVRLAPAGQPASCGA